MIKLELKPFESEHIHEGDCIKNAYINENTMFVEHYGEGVTLDQLDQSIMVIQKVINTICDMTFIKYTHHIILEDGIEDKGLYTARGIEGVNDYAYITVDDNHDWVEIHPYDHPHDEWDIYGIPYDDFKKLLIAQNKENELAYLLLKGVID